MFNFTHKKYAIPTPAVNNYAKGILGEVSETRQYPDGVDPSDLNYWTNDSTLFNHPFILNSAGMYRVGEWPDNAVTRANKQEVMIIGDSGGYQLGTGKLKGMPKFGEELNAAQALERWDHMADRVRKWDVAFSESFTTHAMTLDHPLWLTVAANTKSAFAKCSVEQLTALTVENLHFIEANRQGYTKWLNVVQGITNNEFEYWWAAIKQFQFDGWALAGGAGAKGGIYQMLYAIKRMQEDGAFEDGRVHMHVLGVSTLKWAVFLTAIQNALRVQYDNFTVTYDASSPFKSAMQYQNAYIAPELSQELGSWKLSSTKVPHGFKYRDSTKKFVCDSSPIGKLMTLGDLNVKGGKHAKNFFDAHSLYLIANHNVAVQLEAIHGANEAAFGKDKHKRTPEKYLKCIELIQEAFKVDDWRGFLSKNKIFFDSVAPSKYGNDSASEQDDDS
jgi:hypothetical protein